MIDIRQTDFSEKQGIRKVRGAVHRLPPDSFVYGQVSTSDKQGVKDLIHDWQVNKPRNYLERSLVSKKPSPASFVKRLMEPTQLRYYSKTNKSLKGSSTNHSNSQTKRSFGLPLRPSTPIEKVLSHFYGRTSSEISLGTQKRHKPRAYLRYGSTRGFELLKSSKLPRTEKKVEFKMKKFNSVQGRIQCWRHKL